MKHFGEDIPIQSCICRAHSREAARYLNDPEYIPTWKREKKSHSVSICMHPECTSTSTEELMQAEVYSPPLSRQDLLTSAPTLTCCHCTLHTTFITLDTFLIPCIIIILRGGALATPSQLPQGLHTLKKWRTPIFAPYTGQFIRQTMHWTILLL